jgi:hypothetical protein
VARRGIRRKLFSSRVRRGPRRATARLALGFFLRRSRPGSGKLVRKLLRIRRNRPQLRSGACYFFNDWDRHLSKGLLLFARYSGPAYTLVAINTSDVDQTVPFWFPIGGNYSKSSTAAILISVELYPCRKRRYTYPPTTVASGPRSDPNDNTTAKVSLRIPPVRLAIGGVATLRMNQK